MSTPVANIKPKINKKIKKVKCGKSSYFVTFGRGMSAAVYMLSLIIYDRKSHATGPL